MGLDTNRTAAGRLRVNDASAHAHGISARIACRARGDACVARGVKSAGQRDISAIRGTQLVLHSVFTAIAIEVEAPAPVRGVEEVGLAWECPLVVVAAIV